MSIKQSDIPSKDSFKIVAGEILINYNSLIQFREKFTAEQIIERISLDPLFKLDSFPKNPYSDDVIIFSNCIGGLLVTWDEVALASIHQVVLKNPATYALEEIFHQLSNSKFPEKKLLLNFCNELIKEIPKIKTVIKKIGLIEQLEFDLANGVVPLKLKRAVSPEEREKDNEK